MPVRQQALATRNVRPRGFYTPEVFPERSGREGTSAEAIRRDGLNKGQSSVAGSYRRVARFGTWVTNRLSLLRAR
jgi:hypothetical protein